MATVEKRGKSYRITVAAGIDLKGKQIRHRLVWTPDPKLTPRQVEKELNRQVVRFEEQVKSGVVAVDGNVRFADFAERYMVEYSRLNLKPTTLSNYERNLGRINQSIGHIRLKDLTTLHIQAFYRNLQEQGIRQHTTATATPALTDWITGQHSSQYALAKKAGITHQTAAQAMKGNTINLASAEKIAAATGLEVKALFTINTDTTPLAPATIRSYHRTISSILEKAVKWGCIPSNPAERAELPSQVACTHYLRLALRPTLAGRQPGRRRGAYRPDLQLCIRQGRICGDTQDRGFGPILPRFPNGGPDPAGV